MRNRCLIVLIRDKAATICLLFLLHISCLFLAVRAAFISKIVYHRNKEIGKRQASENVLKCSPKALPHD